MKLTLFKRDKKSQGVLNALRREGKIPAILYSSGKEGETIAVNASEIKAVLRRVKPGCLPTTIFQLSSEGRKAQAILKDIQYHPTSYEILHLDFEELIENVKVNVKVPIQCTGMVDCVGIKLGGVLRQVIRYLKVNCLPKDIPSEFSLDIKELQITQTKRLSEIEIPSTVRPLVNMNEVAVVIAKR